MSFKLMNALEQVGQIAAAGYGDKAFLGAVLGFIKDVTPAQLYTLIVNDVDLIGPVNEDTWDMVKRFTGSININKVTVDSLLDELRSSRLDLMGIIINTPGGERWISVQLERVKAKLKN
ncbi:MAG: hypothetical protein ABSF21_00340 [Dehalococcoidia bacterium]